MRQFATDNPHYCCCNQTTAVYSFFLWSLSLSFLCHKYIFHYGMMLRFVRDVVKLF